MVTIIKSFKCFNNVIISLKNVSLNKSIFFSYSNLQRINNINRYELYHTTFKKYSLMEFFDKKENWGEHTIKHGRSWTKDELRNKSNEDLHKLWYVLLKEKNMLLTMEHAANQQYEVMANPERYDKVKKSMSNLETVVRERNEAFYYLETGESGERPAMYIKNVLGLTQRYKLRQYSKPRFLNATWRRNFKFGYNGYAVRKFLRLYNEKKWNIKRKNKNRQANTAISLIRKFPDLDLNALKKKYPLINLKKVLKHNKLKSLRVKSLVD